MQNPLSGSPEYRWTEPFNGLDQSTSGGPLGFVAGTALQFNVSGAVLQILVFDGHYRPRNYVDTCLVDRRFDDFLRERPIFLRYPVDRRVEVVIDCAKGSARE